MSAGTASPSIRRVHPADLEQLGALCQAHAAHEGAVLSSSPSVMALEAALSGPAPALAAWTVADAEGRLQGYASGYPGFCTWAASPVFFLDCLYLEPGHRGRGDGRRLLQAVAAQAAALGCSRMEWVTPGWNIGAIGFYQAQGARGELRTRFRLPLAGTAVNAVQPDWPCR